MQIKTKKQKNKQNLEFPKLESQRFYFSEKRFWGKFCDCFSRNACVLSAQNPREAASQRQPMRVTLLLRNLWFELHGESLFQRLFLQVIGLQILALAHSAMSEVSAWWESCKTDNWWAWNRARWMLGGDYTLGHGTIKLYSPISWIHGHCALVTFITHPISLKV
jgi:hypothetical protein